LTCAGGKPIAYLWVRPGPELNGQPMTPLSDLPDPEKGRKMFEDLYGPERGPRRFRIVLKILVPLAVVAVGFFLVAQITGSWSTIYSSLRGALSTTPPSQAPSSVVPSQPPGCIVSGGENYGKIEQTCK
jgi:hypothetical protein